MAVTLIFVVMMTLTMVVLVMATSQFVNSMERLVMWLLNATKGLIYISFSSVDLTSYQANVAFTSNFGDHEQYVDSSATNHITVDMNNLTIKVDYMGNEKLMVGNGSKLAMSHFGLFTLQKFF